MRRKAMIKKNAEKVFSAEDIKRVLKSLQEKKVQEKNEDKL